MKKRVVSAAVIIAVLVLVIIFSGVPYILNIFIAALSACALYEALIVTEYIESKSLTVISLLFAVSIPFIHYAPALTRNAFTLGIFAFVMILFITLLASYKIFSLEHLSVVFLLSVMIPLFFTTIVYCRNLPYGLYNIIFIFLCAWGTDTGGYIFGRLFGRNKMAPLISPKKTYEGAIGGILASVVACLCLSYVADVFNDTISVNYVLVIIYALIGGVFAILGDLIASLIKRNFNVKDFGTLIPGHGGIMDRFDSVLFSAPMIYLMIAYYPILFAS